MSRFIHVISFFEGGGGGSKQTKRQNQTLTDITRLVKIIRRANDAVLIVRRQSEETLIINKNNY